MAKPVMSDFSDLMARAGNDILNESMDKANVAWSELAHKDVPGGKHVINVVRPGVQGSGFISEGGARQSGTTRKPVQGEVLPKFLHTTLAFNNGTIMTYGNKVGDAADYLESEIRAAGEMAGRQAGQSLFCAAGKICNIVSSAAPSGSTVAITVADDTLFVEGEAYEIVNRGVGNADGYAFVLELTGKAASATGFGGVLTFSETVEGVTHLFPLPTFVSLTTEIYQRGSIDPDQIGLSTGAVIAASSDNPNSLLDVASASSTLHGIAPGTHAFWKGNTYEMNGAAATQEAVIAKVSRVRQACGKRPDIAFVGAGVHNALAVSAVTATSSAFGLSTVGNTRKMVDASLNKYGKEIMEENKLMIGSVRIILDDNVPSDASAATDNSSSDGYGDMYLVNTDECMILEWQKLEAEKQGNDMFIVDQTSYQTKAFFSQAFNLAVTQRRAHGVIREFAVSA